MRTTTAILKGLVTKTVRVQKGDITHEGMLMGRDDDYGEGTRDWVVFWVDDSANTSEFRFKANAGWSVTVIDDNAGPSLKPTGKPPKATHTARRSRPSPRGQQPR